MIQDKDTNIVYISSKLSQNKEYNKFYSELTELFDELEIRYDRIWDTKDIWVRDFMPIQITDTDFLKYQYHPDYLRDVDEYKNCITDCTVSCRKKGIKYRETDIVIDGGNVVLCGDKVIMTDKVFAENNKKPGDTDFINELENVFGHKVVIIPWEATDSSIKLTKEYIEEKKPDVYGHSDGLIKYCGDNRILMSNYRDDKEEIAIKIRQKLEYEGYEVTEMLFDVPNPNAELNWAYINFLQVGNNIIMPKFGIAEDIQAKRYIQNAFPYCRVRQIDCTSLAKNGGALHCITWNIKK